MTDEFSEVLGIDDGPEPEPPAPRDMQSEIDENLGITPDSELEAELEAERNRGNEPEEDTGAESDELERLRLANADLTQRFENARRMAEYQAAAQQQEEEESRWQEDPGGFLKTKLERMEQQHQQEQAIAALGQAAQSVNADEQRFASEHTDYYDALDFVRDKVGHVLRASNPEAPQAWIDNLLQDAQRRMAIESVVQGASAAQRAYDYAKRLGWGQDRAGNSAGRSRARSVDPPDYRPDLGPPASTSLSAAHGRGSGGHGKKVTAEQFDRMSDSDPRKIAILESDQAIYELDTRGVTTLL